MPRVALACFALALPRPVYAEAEASGDRRLSDISTFWEVLSADSPTSTTPCTLTQGGRCIKDRIGNYGNSERCTFSARRAFTLEVPEFSVEQHSSCAYDWLDIGGIRYCGYSASHTKYLRDGAVSVVPGDVVSWKTDGSVVRSGFTICAPVEAGDSPQRPPSPPTPPMAPNDDFVPTRYFVNTSTSAVSSTCSAHFNTPCSISLVHKVAIAVESALEATSEISCAFPKPNPLPAAALRDSPPARTGRGPIRSKRSTTAGSTSALASGRWL